jgi:hypothetical protein
LIDIEALFVSKFGWLGVFEDQFIFTAVYSAGIALRDIETVERLKYHTIPLYFFGIVTGGN